MYPAVYYFTVCCLDVCIPFVINDVIIYLKYGIELYETIPKSKLRSASEE